MEWFRGLTQTIPYMPIKSVAVAFRRPNGWRDIEGQQWPGDPASTG